MSALVSNVDLAPTLLELAKVEPGADFEGKSFLRLLSNPGGPPVRRFAYAEKNWHDYEDHSQPVRGQKYKYIRNYFDDLPPTPPADAVRGVTYSALKKKYKAGELEPAAMQLFISPRPKEELYDCDADPHELNNLIGSAEHAKVALEMRKALIKWQDSTEIRFPAGARLMSLIVNS